MARFDVYEASSGLMLDCQADVLSDLNTRFVVPLMSPDEAPVAGKHLNPFFQLLGRDLVMVTQFAAAVYVRDLGDRVGSLDHEHSRILNALDMLIVGY